MFKISRIVAFFLMFWLTPSQADVMVLVHGYQGVPDDWRVSGIAARLGDAGWEDAGVIDLSNTGEPVLPERVGPADNYLYTVKLPSEDPILLQAQTLSLYLQSLAQRHAYEPLIVVGHSAGGVVARSALVRTAASLPVAQLITIATPHLGTALAEAGATVAKSPLAWVAPLLGGSTLYHSEQLFTDLMPERPGSLLFMLNRQPHPRIDYVSVVRREAYGLPGDLLVPRDSQRLEHVYALRGLARSIDAGYGHQLQQDDGEVILRVLNGQRYL